MCAAAAAAFVVAVAASPSTNADLVRGSIKIDVRDASGKPAAADVRAQGPNGDTAVVKSGDIYVAGGLVDGEWIISAGGQEQRVRVSGRQDVGVVFVVGPTRKKDFVPTLLPSERACNGNGSGDGILVEAVGFGRGSQLGAGRVDVRARGKIVCSAILAGGAASLRLPAGDYDVSARFVGGGQARERYRVRDRETPTPLVLRAR